MSAEGKVGNMSPTEKIANMPYQDIQDWLATQPLCPECTWGWVVWKYANNLRGIEISCLSCWLFKIYAMLPGLAQATFLSQDKGIQINKDIP